MSLKPCVCDIVGYTLNEADARAINKRREDFHAYQHAHAPSAEPGQPGATGHQAHLGNMAEAGQVYPAIVVGGLPVGSEVSSMCNLQVLLDGNDTYWATSRVEGDQPGTWAWPTLAEELPGVLPDATASIPSIGDIVHYVSYGTPGGEHKSECRAAIVTAVGSGTVAGGVGAENDVSLCVLNPTGQFFNQGVEYHDGAETPGSPGCPDQSAHGNPFRYCGCGWAEASYRGGTWHWPEGA